MGDGQGEKKRKRQDLEDLGRTCPTPLGPHELSVSTWREDAGAG